MLTRSRSTQAIPLDSDTSVPIVRRGRGRPRKRPRGRNSKASTSGVRRADSNPKEEVESSPIIMAENNNNNDNNNNNNNNNENVPPNQGNRPLSEYGAPEAYEFRSGNRLPDLPQNNYEFPANLIRMIKVKQFSGRTMECPFRHLNDFIQLCNIVNGRNASQEQTRLHLFHFSLDGRALAWLESLPPNSLTTWDQLSKAFLERFFSEEKTSEIKRKISTFAQEEDETLSEAWERFKELRRSCPHHGFDLATLLRVFYDGLTTYSRSNLNAAGGRLLTIPLNQVEATIEAVVRDYAWGSEGGRR